MKKYFAEFIGTFILVFCGTGAAVIDEVIPGSVTHTGVAITFGLVVMAMIYSIGDISGSHLNPAVSISFAIARLFSWREVIPYAISQTAGAVTASLLLHFMFPSSLTLGSTLPASDAMQSFLMEIVLSFILMFVVFRVATGSKEQGLFAGAAIGSIVLLEAMFAGPVSGASMNPARSFAPAMISHHTQFLWVYLTAPIIGMALAVPCYQFLKNKHV
ncbi:MAG: aquaporin [Bacteroidota bacterium]